MSTIRSFQAVTDARGRAWRWVTVLAGLVLVVTFFLPITGRPVSFTQSSSLSDSPFMYFCEFLKYDASSGGGGPWMILVIFAQLLIFVWIPHVWGVCMAVFSYAQLRHKHRLRTAAHISGFVFGAILEAIWLGLVGFYTFSSLRGSSLSNTSVFFVIALIVFWAVILAPMVYALFAIRRRPCTYLYHGLVIAVVMLLSVVLQSLFLQWFLGPQPGPILSAMAVVVMLIARVGEARALTQQSWLKTLWQLLSLRLHKGLPAPGQCPACGYNLFGLTEQRCPECGRPFTFEELAVTSEELGFAGVAEGGATP